ncbi:retrovirus-related pol polyprotein from transposon TNT 1-94 [Tanacetum coccineum]
MFMTLIKQSQELKSVSYHKLYDILKQHQNEVNEIRAERLARTANPLALVAQQQPVYHPQNHPNHYTQNSSTRSQQAATRNRGKIIVNSPPPTYDQEPDMVSKDDTLLKEKEIDKLMALISLSFKKIYKPTNNNLRTSSNTRLKIEDNTPMNLTKELGMIIKGDNVARAKRISEMLEILVNAEQADWRDDTDDEHKIMVQNDNDNYNVFANDSEHPEQPESVNDTYPNEQNDTNIPTDSLNMRNNRGEVDQDIDEDLAKERDLLASLIEKLKCEIDENKDRNKLLESSNKTFIDKLKSEIKDFKNKNKCLESSNNHLKEANTELAKNNQLMFKDLKKFQAELDRYHDVNYASKAEIELVKCERLGKEISKRTENVNNKSFNELSKRFSELEQHSINLELALQQCQEQIKNDKAWKQKESNSFRELNVKYFEIQDLKTQLRDKDIAISELKKLIEKMKGKYVETKFEKPSLIRQLNAFKIQRQSIIGKPATFLDSLAKKDFSKSKSVTKNDVSKDFSKPDTAQILPQNVKSILKNTNVIAPGITKQPISMPISTREPKQTVNQSVATPLKRTVAAESTNQKPRSTIRKQYEQIRNDLLTCSYSSDLYSITLQDTSTPNPICLMAKASSSQAWLWHRRLSHLNFDTINLLSKYDIVTGLPKLKFVKDHLCSSCELGKAKRKSFKTKTTPSSKRRLQILHMDLCGPMRVESFNGKKYVLVIVDDYSRYTWTHFLRSKDETPEVLIDFLKLVQRGLHAQVRTVRTDKGTEFLNKTLHAYFAQEGIEHQTSTARTPEQNGIVERRNRTLVEAARTMLSAAKVPLFFWAEAIATACFTQNRSLIISRHEKTPYHLINGQKPSVKFFHIFGSLCYIIIDGKNLDKMKEKGNACIFVGYSTQSRAYRVYNKRTRVIVETIHVNFDELLQMASDQVSYDPVPQSETVTTSNELDFLFSLMFDELLNVTTQVMSKSSAVTIADAPNQRQQQHTTSSTSTTAVTAKTNKEYAQDDEDEFINIFCTPVQERGETSSRYVDSSNMHTFYQQHPSEHR